MDEFLRELHTSFFRSWILNQSSPQLPIVQSKDPDVLTIDLPTCHGEITFNPMSIIEFIVTNTNNQRIDFYIHFQMNTLSHAIGLFEEMKQCIFEIQETKKTRILLSCSGGLTTSFFTEELTNAAQLLNLDYEFEAVPYTRLFEEGGNYDVILLAPQISFLHAKVIQVLKDPLIIKIPPRIFAKYDVDQMLTLIRHEMKHFHKKEVTSSVTEIKEMPIAKEKTLCISVKRVQAPRININYKLFDGKQVLQESEIIKTNISERDIYDIVEVMFAKYPDIKAVGISMLGIVQENGVYLPNSMFDGVDFMTYLKERYPAKFVLENDGNCAALGYYVTQNQYRSISLVTRTRQLKPGGVGSIFNGELIRGHCNLAGELQYLPLGILDYAQTINGFIEQLAHSILSVMAILAPEAIVIYAPALTEINDVLEIVKKKVPEQFLPSFILIDDLREYATIGLLQLCIDSMDES